MGAFSVADDDRRQATASQIRTPARDEPTCRLPIRQSVADSGGGPGGAVLLRNQGARDGQVCLRGGSMSRSSMREMGLCFGRTRDGMVCRQWE